MGYCEMSWCETGKHLKCNLPTPCYVFDEEILLNGIRQIKEELLACNKVCYAMKANPFIVSAADKEVDRFEVCSPGEYEICHRYGINHEKIIISGVNKTYDSIERIIELGGGRGIYTIESKQHYKIISKLAKKHNFKVKMFVRLSSGNQFGVSESDLEDIFEENIGNEYCNIIGVHYFSGTQKRMKKIERELIYLDDYAKKLKEKFNIESLELEYGPGLAVSYFEDDKKPGREEQLIKLNELLSKLKNFDSIGIELGRFISADCGCFITKVDDVKKIDKTEFAILDSGIHQFGYYGQMMGMKIPPILQSDNSYDKHIYTVCGALCTINDVILRDANLYELSIGSTLLFQKCGAYSVTEGMSLFLSRDLPAVYLYSENKEYICLRSSYETDILNSFK